MAVPGDAEAEAMVDDLLERLFDRHYERLLRLARRLATDQETALDLVQETFLRAARHRARLPAHEPAGEAWLVRVLVNLARDLGRRRRVRGHEQELCERQAASGPLPDARAVARRTVERALAVLPARRRAVVLLHELEERPVEEIARLLGIAKVTVRWHLAAGMRQLAAQLLTSGPAGKEEEA